MWAHATLARTLDAQRGKEATAEPATGDVYGVLCGEGNATELPDALREVHVLQSGFDRTGPVDRRRCPMTHSRNTAALAILAVFLYVFVWKWTICRVYVAPGEMLVLTSRFGAVNERSTIDLVVDDAAESEQLMHVDQPVPVPARHDLQLADGGELAKRARQMIPGNDEKREAAPHR